MAKKIIAILLLITGLMLFAQEGQEKKQPQSYQSAIDLNFGVSTLFGNFWFVSSQEAGTVTAGLLGLDMGIILHTPIIEKINAVLGYTGTFRIIQAIFTDNSSGDQKTPWSSHLKAGIRVGDFGGFSFGINIGTLIDIGDGLYSGTSAGATLIYKSFMLTVDSIYQESLLINVGVEYHIPAILKF
ncbi:hypothetical protein WKV44_01370 [Spirochaetia bacterium 38H-sp]|uniref:Outer membrane protein beta-barrel domain-containing protein n=1 Tax=Rarispira pelagica TaxID=3141764 RepID=A0ABU9U932_9SPIR